MYRKKARDVKEQIYGAPDTSQQQHMIHNTLPKRDQKTFKHSGRPTERFTSLGANMV